MENRENIKEKMTPMMEQYWSVRNTLPDDTVLLFRLGDFYEMFHSDAQIGSQILGITLTRRQNYPMAGIPYHAAQQYILKLLAAGKKVAICDQNEPAVTGQIVKRSLSRILTPGTAIEDSQLDSKSSNFALAIDIDSAKNLYASWLDISTGEFYYSHFDNIYDFLPILSAISPKEIILPENASRKWITSEDFSDWNIAFRNIINFTPVTLLGDYRFEPSWAAEQICDALSVLSLDGFGISNNSRSASPAGALIFYITQNLRAKPENIKTLRNFSGKKCVLIDPSTQRNLELFRSTQGSKEGSLLSILDRTQTAVGGRLLSAYLTAPTIDIEEINRRQNIVWQLYSCPAQINKLADKLAKTRDIPRILSRLQNRLRNPRELLAVEITLEQFEPIKHLLKSTNTAICQELADNIADFSQLCSYLKNAISDDVPSKIQDGGTIRKGFDEQLDRLRSLSEDNMQWLSQLEQAEQKRTGIKNLRIKYNGSFGYFIEVTKSYLSQVPADYIRKRTMTNAERFTTDELKEKEREILNAEELSLQREQEIFIEVIEEILKYAPALYKASETIAQIDVFRGWAELSIEWDYCKPIIDNSDSLDIIDGRHPVVEQMLKYTKIGSAKTDFFVPNDTYLSSSDEQIALITGPNMAGKSTYIRQIALIAIMAQIGCFVPAKRCKMGVVDRIFSRVGASDELSKGNSTFMVEMNETANILNNATDKSLIILDEIGRGTSTYDGLSIAWSVVEFIHGSGSKGPKTLFATHYHEITKLTESLPRLQNYRVCVKEYNDEIIFARKIEKGFADKSYGIQVARLAGLPEKVISRAKEVLSELENEGNCIIENLGGKKMPKQKRKTKIDNDSDDSNFKQLSFF